MKSRHLYGVVAGTLAALVTATACSGDDTADRPADAGDGADTSIEMTAVTAETDGSMVRLSWEPVADVESYRIGSGDDTSDVPATICGGECTLSVAPDVVGSGEVAVTAVRADGAYSEPSVVSVDVPEPDPEPETDESLEVVLVHGWDSTAEDARPEVETVPVDSMEEAEKVIAKSREADSGILSASLNRPVSALSTDDDYNFDNSGATWQKDAMRFDLLPGDPPGRGVVIGHIEPGGPDPSHPSLQGVVEDGTNISDPSTTGVADPETHATATSSLIVGQPAGEVPGVAPGATILPVKLGEGGGEAELIKGIIWAVDQGVDVINISAALNCDTPDPASCSQGVRTATDYAESKGVVVVAAAGNNGPGDGCSESVNAAKVPAVFDTVLSVGAHRQDGAPWSCTPGRPDVDVLAPGVLLLHADLNGGYGIDNGTSLAAPLVSGLIAVILAEQPDLSPADIRSMLARMKGPGGRLDVVAILTDLGLIDPEDEYGIDESVVGVYPYEVELGFKPGHPVHDALVRSQQIADEADIKSTGWSTKLFGSYDTKPYGVIGGLIYVHDDGSATATGSWLVDRINSSSSYGVYGIVGPFPAHGVQCEPHPLTVAPSFLAMRWDMPVAVEADVVSGGTDSEPTDSEPTDGEPADGEPTDGEPVEVEMTFSLGEGATADQQGEVPQPSVIYDTWGQCPGQVDAVEAQYGDLGGRMPFGERDALVDAYFGALAEVNELLVEQGPMTTSEPILIDEYGSRPARENEDILIGYDARSLYVDSAE